jgi:hypothetical protein
MRQYLAWLARENIFASLAGRKKAAQLALGGFRWL